MMQEDIDTINSRFIGNTKEDFKAVDGRLACYLLKEQDPKCSST